METGNAKARIAAYDFDGTLIRGDSFIDFAIMAVGRRRLLAAMAAEAPRLAAWKLGLLRGGDVKERLFGRLYRGMEAVDFCRLGESYALRAALRERADVVAGLCGRIVAGERVFIVTASVTDWVRPWAARISPAITVIGTGAATDPSGRLTGRFSTPNCRGAEKVRRLKEALDLPRASYTLTAFGDSSGDNELLAFADYPIKV